MVWVSTVDELAGVWTGEPPLPPDDKLNWTDTSVVFTLARSHSDLRLYTLCET